jgi:hypothetical protein
MALHLRRRTFLATAAAAGLGTLAGCAHPNAVLTMEPSDDPATAERYARTVPPDSEQHATLGRAVENGSTTTDGTRPPFDTDRPYAYEGGFYELSVTEEERLGGTRVTVEVDYATAEDEPGVPLGEFPRPDRDLLSGLFPPEEDRGDGPEMGASAVYTPEEAEGSRLVNEDVSAVRYEGAAYPVTVETRPADRYRYRVETTRVADDAAAYGAELKREFLFTLSGLTEAEREVVARAIDDGYYESSGSDAFESVARRFLEHEPVIGDPAEEGQYLVRYEGTDYWADLYAPFVEE